MRNAKTKNRLSDDRLIPKRLKTLCTVVFCLTGLCLSANTALAQLAHYPLDGDVTDSVGSNDASSGGALSFLSADGRQFADHGEDGLFTLPASISTNLAITDSFEISFDFRIPDSDSVADQYYPIPILSAVEWHGAPDPAGFSLTLMHFAGFTPEETYLNFFYRDGEGNEGGLFLSSSPDAELGEWRRFTLRFEQSKRLLVLSLGNTRIVHNYPEGFDVAGFRDGLLNNPLIFSGLDNRDPEVNPDLHLDEVSIYSPAPPVDNELIAAFEALTGDLNGTQMLSAEELQSNADTIIGKLYLANYSSIQTRLMEYTDTYETLRPPMYEDGVQHSFSGLPPHEQVLQYSQGYVFDTQFVPGNLDTVAGMVFEHHEIAPGSVAGDVPRVATATVELNATYSRDIAAMLSDQSRVVRPTGYYLAAGDIVTVNVPTEVIGQGLSVIVGAHFRNMDYDYIGSINRFPDISAEYPLDATEIKLANPFGGGIYLLVPEGSDAGAVSMTIKNAVLSPYFSARAGHETSVDQWLDMVSQSGAPWADFESDKFMFTIPGSELAGVTNPDEIMARWDEIMDAPRVASGRPTDRPRAEYYSFDTRLVTPAYGAGYPLVISLSEAFRDMDEEGWNPLKVLQYPPHATLFHEMGHNALHPTMSFGEDSGLDQCHFLEAETVNHMFGMSIYALVYGLDKDAAFGQSHVAQPLSFNEAAFDWIISSNFRNNVPMRYDEAVPMDDKEMLKYQPRGWAKYGDIARLFGWQGLGDVNGQFYSAGVEQESLQCDWRPFVVGRDEYIKEASDALGVNMAPLFHFWGINPSEALRLELAGYPKSQKIWDLINAYRSQVAPKSMQDYLAFHNQMYDKMGYQQPRYDEYIVQFDNQFAAAIDAQFQYLIDLYFETGKIFRSGFE